MGRISRSGAFLAAAVALAAAAPAKATEYGLGNYQLGLILPLPGYTPPPGVYFWDSFYLYQGSGELYRHDATPDFTRVTYNFAANVAILAWFMDATLFGGELGFANTSAFGSDTTTFVTPVAGAFGPMHDTTQQSVASIAETEFSGILGWHAGDQHWALTVTGYVPTGYYNVARIAETTLNRPSLDIKGAYTFLSLQSGLEASAALGVMVNGVNTANNYQSGAELHFEWTLAQHLPGGLAAGVGGYFYQQITNDSIGDSAFGPLKGRVAAIGPILTYTLKVGAQQVDFNARWFHEFAAYDRVSGDTIFATLGFPLYSAPPAAVAAR